METTKVAIVGMGTVGSGVAKLLLEQGERISQHAGRRLQLVRAVVRDLKKARSVPLAKGVITADYRDVVRDPEIKVVAQLMGGLEPERSVVLEMLESGKDIVTANKALLAEHGSELFDRARELGRSISFDAAVCGGIPIITNISQCLAANQITSLRGILNGTSNFIVSQMDEQDAEYSVALQEAQRLGYAEADPTLDVNGSDAAQKLSILAHLAFGARLHWREIPRVGIDTLDAADIRYARELGYRIKLIAMAQLTDDGLEASVSPTLCKIGRPLAEVRQAYNAVSVVGNAVGRVFYHGLGAGQMPTASAVLADMIDTVVGRAQITFRTLELWSSRQTGVQLSDPKVAKGRYYMRFMVDDHPGVLSEITGALGRNQISIASIIQHEPAEEVGGSCVPLVIMTHVATEGSAQAAQNEIDRLACVRQGSVRMRVLQG